MKAILVFVATVLAVHVASAQPEQRDLTLVPKPVPPASENRLVTPSKLPSQINRGRVVYSGLAVGVVKTRHPWQWINPFAPADCGRGVYNAQDIFTGKVTGLTVFSVKF